DYTQNDIRGLYVRRFKKDIEAEVGESFRDRELSLERVETNDEEDDVFDLLADAEFRTVGRSGDGTLFRTLLLKAFLSSPDACASTIRKRLDHPDVRDASTEAAEHDRRLLNDLLDAVEAVTHDNNTKLDRLVELLESWDWSGNRYGDRVVIFAERIDTLEMLREFLVDHFNMADDRIAIFDGHLDDQHQQELVSDFGTKDGKVQILLGSDAAAEGINLHHFCHRLVHFDVPLVADHARTTQRAHRSLRPDRDTGHPLSVERPRLRRGPGRPPGH
ncbi:MAG: C-terminal helicase domain-containing protein, partial [Bradymonadaceae bacterium]